jgi:hypothetical protein
VFSRAELFRFDTFYGFGGEQMHVRYESGPPKPKS